MTTRSSNAHGSLRARRAYQRQGCANANLSGQIVKTVDATSQALAILELARIASTYHLGRSLGCSRWLAALRTSPAQSASSPGHLAEAFELRRGIG